MPTEPDALSAQIEQLTTSVFNAIRATPTSLERDLAGDPEAVLLTPEEVMAGLVPHLPELMFVTLHLGREVIRLRDLVDAQSQK